MRIVTCKARAPQQQANLVNLKSPLSKIAANGAQLQSPVPSPYKRPSRKNTPVIPKGPK